MLFNISKKRANMKQKVLYCVLLIALVYQFGNAQIAPEESVGEKLVLEKKMSLY